MSALSGLNSMQNLPVIMQKVLPWLLAKAAAEKDESARMAEVDESCGDLAGPSSSKDFASPEVQMMTDDDSADYSQQSSSQVSGFILETELLEQCMACLCAIGCVASCAVSYSVAGVLFAVL